MIVTIWNIKPHSIFGRHTIKYSIFQIEVRPQSTQSGTVLFMYPDVVVACIEVSNRGETSILPRF